MRRALLAVVLAAAACASPAATIGDARLRVEPDAARPFDDRLPPKPEKMAHEPAPWPFDVLHYDVRLRIDFDRESIEGAVTVRVMDGADGVDVLPLDAAGMTIESVDDAAGEAATWTHAGERLDIALPGGSRSGTERVFTVEYTATPERGLHFIREPEGRPGWGRQVWSQGECEDTRWWIPCHDLPDDRATHAMTVTVPAGMTVVAAGELLSREDDGDESTWRFRIDVPHVSYLMTLVAGDLITVRDDRGSVPNEYVAAGYERPHLAHSLRRTPDVLAFFAGLTGRPYPYPRYAQCCVRDFVFGGMENISASTLTDRTLHPPEWEPARSSDGLVAHEAAHQWFGDLITCRDWSHIWLNEGFATYLTLLWKEHDEGRDAFLASIRGTMNGALGACERARRPVVSNVYAEPFELFFDGHAYGGGAARLHALRVELGDATFFRAVRLYVERCAGRSVTTADFEAVVSEAAGRDMTWWFDQWLRSPGRPKIAASWEWDDGARVLRVRANQTHGEAAFPQAYRLPLDVACDLRDGSTVTTRLDLTEREHVFEIGLPSAPRLVRLDPDRGLLARREVKRPLDGWIELLRVDPSPAGRLDALAEVGKAARRGKDTPQRARARDAILRAAASDTRHEVRRAAVDELKRGRQPWTLAALTERLRGDADLRVRIAAADALGERDGEESAVEALRAVLDGHGELLRASALRALARLDADGAYDLLVAALDTPGWHSHVRGAALQGLADLGDEDAFGVLVAHAARDADPRTRDEALSSLGRMGALRPEYTEAVLPHLFDDRKPVRRAAARALAQLADAGAVPMLMRAFAEETWPGNRDAVRAAIVACRKAAAESGDLVTAEAVRAADVRARHAALRGAEDAESRKQAARLRRELRELGVPPLPAPKPGDPKRDERP